MGSAQISGPGQNFRKVGNKNRISELTPEKRYNIFLIFIKHSRHPGPCFRDPGDGDKNPGLTGSLSILFSGGQGESAGYKKTCFSMKYYINNSHSAANGVSIYPTCPRPGQDTEN